jgi:hypothetical protein
MCRWFQLHLVGDCSGLVGKAEHLRLTALQSHMLKPDGHIRYLNTAGFAVKSSRVDREIGLFNPSAVRAEDTLLLVDLIERGELPFFVENAVVRHAMPLSLTKCLMKDVRAAYLERGTYDSIAARGVRIRVNHWQRLAMLSTMWRLSREESIGRSAWFVILARQALQRTVSTIISMCSLLGPASHPPPRLS